jgi:hypothetical protein
MTRVPGFVAILAAAVFALGSAGSALAHEPAPAKDEQCGAQGEQLSAAQNDDAACGTQMNGQSGDQGAKQDGQTGTDEQGATQSGQSGTDEQGDVQMGPKGDQGTSQNGQQGDDQQGDH